MKRTRSITRPILLTLLLAAAAIPGGVARALPGGPIRVFTLENGLRVVMKEQHEKALVAVNAYVMGGSRTETPEISGLSHYYEHLIFRGGTARQAELETRKVFGGLGTFFGFTSDDVTCYYIVTTPENLDEALWRHADAVMEVDVTQAKVDRERQVVMEEYNMGRARPAYRAYYLLMETAYRVHPYRVTPIGSKEVILNADLDRFRTFYEERYVPNQIVLACVGDFDTEEMLAKIESLWGGYGRGRASFETGLVEPEQEAFREASIAMKTATTYMLWGFHIPEAAHPDIPAIDVLNALLADGDGSRLYRALKIEKNRVRRVTGQVEARRDPGLLVIDLQMDPDREKEAVETVFREIKKIAGMPVPPDELEAAKRKVENGYAFDNQSYIDQARTLAFYAANADIVLEASYLDRVRATTAEDILRVARTYLRPSNLSVATVRPGGTPDRSWARMARRVRIPPPIAAAPASRPPAREVLENGLTYLYRPDFSANTVAVEVYVRGGLAAEDEETNGIGALLAETLMRGTGRRDAEEIAREIDRLGIELDASAHEDFTRVSLLTVPGALRDAVDLLVEVITSPAFDAGEVGKARGDLLSKIRTIQDRSYDLTNREFARLIFDDGPYRMPLLGDVETVERLGRDDLERHHARLFTGGNMIVSMVGTFTPRDRDAVAAAFGAVPEGPRVEFTVAGGPWPRVSKFRNIELDRTQITFDIGTIGVGVDHPDYLPLKLVERVLSRRLFFRYVYEEGIAYRMWTYLRPRVMPSPFTFEMGVSPKNYEAGRDGVLGEVRRVLEEGIPAEDVEDARRNLVTRFMLDMETNVERARNMAFYELAGVGYDYPDRIADAAAEVTPERVNRAARKYLDPDRFTMVVVGRIDGR
jgi:zinc protease